MGTNYYARIIPTKKRKQELIQAIEADDFDTITDLTQELYGHRDQYNDGGKIHLGKSSAGWKFLWNSNIRKIPYYTSDKGPQYDYTYVYPLTKKDITDFVMREDILIYDEYNKKQSKKEFLDFAFNKEGLDGTAYHKEHPAETIYHSEEESMFRDLGYTVECYDFYSDGLRFSTSTWFS